MRAVAVTAFGGPEVLRELDLEAPVPGPGEVAIAVSYAGVNFAEVMYRRGEAAVPLPFVPGIEVAGRVVSVGDGVDPARVGQDVAALTTTRPGGGYAQIAVTNAHLAAPVPAGTDLRVVAAAPSSSTTALLVLQSVAKLEHGETVLVSAAASGVGTQLGQFAREFGASRIVGLVGSAEKIPVAQEHGYTETWLRSELAAKIDAGHRFDVVVDPVGGPMRELGLAALSMGGRLIVMGNASGAQDLRFSANDLWFSGKGVLGFSIGHLSTVSPELVGSALREAVRAVVERKVSVKIDRTLPLHEAKHAHTLLESSAIGGKIVLAINGKNGL